MGESALRRRFVPDKLNVVGEEHTEYEANPSFRVNEKQQVKQLFGDNFGYWSEGEMHVEKSGPSYPGRLGQPVVRGDSPRLRARQAAAWMLRIVEKLGMIWHRRLGSENENANNVTEGQVERFIGKWNVELSEVMPRLQTELDHWAEEGMSEEDEQKYNSTKTLRKNWRMERNYNFTAGTKPWR